MVLAVVSPPSLVNFWLLFSKLTFICNAVYQCFLWDVLMTRSSLAAEESGGQASGRSSPALAQARTAAGSELPVGAGAPCRWRKLLRRAGCCCRA